MSSVSVEDVTVAPRTGVAARVLGLAALGTDGPAGLHQRVRLLDEGSRLRPSDQHARRGGVAALLFLEELVGDDQDAVTRFVVADSDRGDDPGRVDGLEQREVLGRHPADAGQLVERSEERRVGKEGRSRWSPYH